MELQKPDYTYRVTVDRVVDADTVDVFIDVGFYTTVHKRLRLLEFDAEEMRDRDPDRRAKAQVATDRMRALLDNADSVYIQTKMDATGKYGRLLAYLWAEKDGMVANLNEQMVHEGFQKAPKQ